jgi:hypothetical protein
VKVLFDSLINQYRGSTLEALCGENNIHSYLAPENASLPYTVFMMDPSPITRAMSAPLKVHPVIIITPYSDFEGGQVPLEELRDAVIDTYDGGSLTVQGYRLVVISAAEMNQELEISDPENPLWAYPIKFKISLE